MVRARRCLFTSIYGFCRIGAFKNDGDPLSARPQVSALAYHFQNPQLFHISDNLIPGTSDDNKRTNVNVNNAFVTLLFWYILDSIVEAQGLLVLPPGQRDAYPRMISLPNVSISIVALARWHLDAARRKICQLAIHLLLGLTSPWLWPQVSRFRGHEIAGVFEAVDGR